MAPERDAPKQNPADKIPNSGTSGETSNEAAPIVRADLQILTTAIDTYKAEEQKKSRLERWRFYVEVLTLIAVVSYGAVAFYQWREMARSTSQGEQAANAAKDAVKHARENFQVDQRAWVGVKHISFRGQLKPGSELFAVIQVQNTGKTPALEVTINHTLTFSRPTKDYLAKLPKIGTFGKMSIAPDGTYVAIQMFSGKLSETEIEKLNKNIPFVFGRIAYKDVFGGNHQTWFCSFYRQDFFPALHFCETLNDMD